MVPCKSTAGEVSFEWPHHRISSTDSKVRTTLHVFMIDHRCNLFTIFNVVKTFCIPIKSPEEG